MGLFENYCDIGELEYEVLLEVVDLHQIIRKEHNKQLRGTLTQIGDLSSPWPTNS